MNGFLRRVPAADWKKAQRDEDFLLELTSVDEGAALLANGDILKALPWYFRWPAKLLYRKQLASLGGQGGAAAGTVLDLHKSWQALHWLLCESPWEGPEPLRSAILGGEEKGEDLGYGPARLVDPGKVGEVAKALALLSAAQILQRYDGRKMEAAEVYPGGFADDEDWQEELQEEFERLKVFYAEAAKRGEGVVSWLS
ncbi:MAG: YfbM family protein [Bryobacter sp.]|nr:YfbM family protein [Bryobacter sp.]